MLFIEKNATKRDDLIEKGKLRQQSFSWQKSADLLWNSIQKTMAN
jgi:hypothetical protein